MSKKARSFCFTFYKYKNHEVDLVCLDYEYLVYGVEVCPTTGRWHLQGYICFKNPRHFSAVAKLFKWHVEIAAGGPTANFNYCSKEGAYVEFGIRPMDSGDKGKAEKERYRLARISATAGDFENIPADLYVRHLSSFKRIYREDAIPKPSALQPRATYGVWIHGPPRTGKTHSAIHDYGTPVYIKPANKWWDDYRGEPTVVINDITPRECVDLSSLIKLWVDRWPFAAEIKGGSLTLRPNLVVVTSNYALDACFTGTELEAIQARFEVVEKKEVFTGL